MCSRYHRIVASSHIHQTRNRSCTLESLPGRNYSAMNHAIRLSRRRIQPHAVCRASSTEVSMSSSTLQLATGVLDAKRDCLAKAITLIESSNKDHRMQAKLLLEHLAQNGTVGSKDGKPTLRLGIAGPPGAGKSTFIEALGTRLIKKANKVAVIPVDPSSHISGGSILGDKTRMEVLSRSSDAYVRASPTRGVLGGIAEHTVDVITLCEAAGFNVVIVESVGLGQSEVDIDAAVDMLILLVPPGGGDGLQASKKGIMEATDLIIVNKADGSLLDSAKHTKADYSGAMQFVRRKYVHWGPKVLMISAHTGHNLDQVEQEIKDFHDMMITSNSLFIKRSNQAKQWMRSHFQRTIISEMENHPLIKDQISRFHAQLEAGYTTPRAAADNLMSSIHYEVKPPADN